MDWNTLHIMISSMGCTLDINNLCSMTMDVGGWPLSVMFVLKVIIVDFKFNFYQML